MEGMRQKKIPERVRVVVTSGELEEGAKLRAGRVLGVYDPLTDLFCFLLPSQNNQSKEIPSTL